MARRSKGGRTKDGRILVRIGEDSRKRLARNAAREKSASDRAIRKEAKKAATRLRRSQREIAKRAMQLARRLARERARDARRAAKRAGNNKPTEEYNRQREENASKKRKKRPFHPRGPYATEKYTSYARRLERSEKLTANVINETTASVGRWIIKTTTGGIPLSCNCPDFTQIDGSRSWKGSSAGPFNPCKHMIAVQKDKWKCENGVCVKSKFGLYNTKAECESARIPANFTGGQCVGVEYLASGTRYLKFADNAPTISTNSDTGIGPILGISAVWIRATPTNDHSFYLEIIFSNKTVQLGGQGYNKIFPDSFFVYSLLSTAVSRVDGLPDTCGDRYACPT